MSAETEIRALIASWVDAVQSHDLEAVVARHAQDVVMFDVPPPPDGIRGIDEYRDSWGPFFDWQRQTDGVFELVELNVVAGDEVAFAYGLLRCGSAADVAAEPDHRLRVTVGLRLEEGQWLVAHEHHSFPMV